MPSLIDVFVFAILHWRVTQRDSSDFLGLINSQKRRIDAIVVNKIAAIDLLWEECCMLLLQPFTFPYSIPNSSIDTDAYFSRAKL